MLTVELMKIILNIIIRRGIIINNIQRASNFIAPQIDRETDTMNDITIINAFSNSITHFSIFTYNDWNKGLPKSEA